MKKLRFTLIISFLILFLISCNKPIKEYEAAYEFSEGLAAVKIDGKYGYIDKDKNLIINPVFDIANSFHNGKSWVRVKKKYGIIDRKGVFFVEPQFDDILNYDYQLYEFTIVQKNSKWGCIDTITGNLVVNPIYDEIYPIPNLNDAFIIKKNNKKGYINLQNEIYIEPIYSEIKPYPYENILIVNLKGKYGMLNLKGVTIVEPKYSYIGSISSYDELIMISKNNKIGFIDRNENFIIEPRFEDVRSFREGLAPVMINNKWGYIDRTGNLTIKPNFTLAEPFEEGLARVKFENGKWGCIDKKSNVIIEPIYERISFPIESLYSAKLDKYGVIDKDGDTIIPFKYDKPIFFHDNLAKITYNKKVGLVNKQGKTIIEPIYNKILYDKNYILLKNGDNWILCDLKGTFLKNLPYEDLGFTKAEGLTPAKLNNKWGFVDDNYNLVIEATYDEVGYFSEGLAHVMKDGKYFYIDFRGNKK